MRAAVKVLVIEDDAALRKVLELRLRLEGFEVVLAEDGQMGLDVLVASNPDVVVTDLMMPRLDGCGFARRARRLPGFEELPIILLTAHPRDGYVEDLLELGGITFMSKPFEAPVLTGALRELGGGPRPEARLRAS